MLSLLERWRAGPPEFIILAGSSVGFVANAVSLALAVLIQASGTWPASVAVSGSGMGLAILAALVLRRHASSTSRNFVYVGAVATAMAVLSFAGLIGGGLALAGAIWGIIRTYEPRP